MNRREFLPVPEHKAWVIDAQEKLRVAENSLDDSTLEAYLQAHESAEFLLKAVLVREGKFVPGMEEDYTHKLLPLLDKIDREKCLPSEAIIKAREIVPELDRIDVGTPRPAPSHVDSSVYTAEVEYEKAGVPATARISKEMAEKEINLSRQLLELLLPYLDC